MTTNEFERDLNDQSGLKRAGRVDLRVFQNSADVGDGHPGVQRCFRNYLHEGGMEKDLDLVGYGIKGTSVDINNAELQQLSNIGSSVITDSIWTQLNNIEATTISTTQWVYVGEADQPVKQTDSPTFDGLTINGNITITGNVDDVNISTHAINVNAHISNLNQIPARSHTVLSDIGTNAHAQIDAHIPSTATPHVSAAEKTSWGTAVTHITQNGSSHSFINQNVTTGGSPTFASVNTSLIARDTNMTIGPNNYSELRFQTSLLRWKIEGGGHFYPNDGNTYDIGSAEFDVRYLYYCNLSETSCADFTDKTVDELYNMFAQIRPRTDNIVHKTKNMTFRHIDFNTLPNEFARKADKHFIKDNIVMIKDGIEVGMTIDSDVEMTTINYEIGDNCAIEMSTYIHALKDFVVKSYEKIKELEKEIEVLKYN